MSQMQDEQDRPTGMFKDIKRLKSDGSASVEELRQFLDQLRGRSPQEMLGLVAESGLFRGMITATIGMVAILFVFTVGPWAYNSMAGETPRQRAAAQQAAKPKSQSAPVQPVVKPSEATAKTTTGDGPDLKGAAKALEIDQTKTGVPDIDSLIDKRIDD